MLQASCDNTLSTKHTNLGESENFDVPGFVPILPTPLPTITPLPPPPQKKGIKRNTHTPLHRNAQMQGHAVLTSTHSDSVA